MTEALCLVTVGTPSVDPAARCEALARLLSSGWGLAGCRICLGAVPELDGWRAVPLPVSLPHEAFILLPPDAAGRIPEVGEPLRELVALALSPALSGRELAPEAADSPGADLVRQLKLLNQASAQVGKTLNVASACQELLAHVPGFMTIHWQAIYLLKEGRWEYVYGSSPIFDRPPDAWLAALDDEGLPASKLLPREFLADTPFDTAGQVILFPLTFQARLHGLLMVATETGAAPAGVDMVETLVGHTALVIDHALMVEGIERQAVTDGLTGIPNRRHFNDRLTIEIQRAQRFNRPLSLVMLDLDHFKAANDLLGHQAGDRVLQEVAGLLRSSVRRVDLAARYGGEEFAVLLPETAAENALHVAQKLRHAIHAHRFPDQERLPHGNITASLGVATLPPGGSPEILVALADQALYAAKRAGRNRVCQAP